MNNINVIIRKCSAGNVVKLISTSDKNIFDGFMNWLNYLIRKCVIPVILKRNVFENVVHVRIRCVLDVSRFIIKSILIHVLTVDMTLLNILKKLIIDIC